MLVIQCNTLLFKLCCDLRRSTYVAIPYGSLIYFFERLIFPVFLFHFYNTVQENRTLIQMFCINLLIVSTVLVVQSALKEENH